MEDYNIAAETVTISIEEFYHLIKDSRHLRCLANRGIMDWEGYSDATRDFFNTSDYNLDELSAEALQIMCDESRDDYELEVAREWLYYYPRHSKIKISQWCSIMRDLEDQLKAIITKERD